MGAGEDLAWPVGGGSSWASHALPLTPTPPASGSLASKGVWQVRLQGNEWTGEEKTGVGADRHHGLVGG